ncbi:MAG: hypothetical protein ACFCUJ_13425 [Thiotrichales bacterium]
MNDMTPTTACETLLASTFFLLSRYSLERCADLAEAIAQHFELLQAHPEVQRSRALHSTCNALLLQWQRVARQVETPSTPTCRVTAPSSIH